MRSRFLPTGDDHRVTTLELLFDLVFVYAITAVSASIAHNLSLRGLTEGLVLMALIWFGWSAYAWLGNQARADEGPLRVSMYLAMAAYFVVALTIHEAFDDLPGGLPGPVVFVVAYAVIRLAHLVLYWFAAGDDIELRHTIQRTLATTLVALALLFVGALLSPSTRLAVWGAAVLIDYLGIFVGGDRGWRVAAPGHFAERHGLVMIIAIGESVVSVGDAISHGAIDWPLLCAALLGITLAIALWRTYFNAIAVAVEQKLESSTAMTAPGWLVTPSPTSTCRQWSASSRRVGLRVMLDDVACTESVRCRDPGRGDAGPLWGRGSACVTQDSLTRQLARSQWAGCCSPRGGGGLRAVAAGVVAASGARAALTTLPETALAAPDAPTVPSP